MSDILERENVLARWKAGPDRDTTVKLLGEPPVSLRLERVHFPGKRPVQLVYAAKRRSGMVTTLLAEDYPCDPEEAAARVVASLRKSRKGQGNALERFPVLADRTSGLVLRHMGLDERLPGLRILYNSSFARDRVETMTGQQHRGYFNSRLLAHRLGKRAVVRLDCGDRRFFARLRATKSNEGEKRLARHRAISEALTPDMPLTVPKPLGVSSDIGLSLFGELAGCPPRFDRDHIAIADALATLQNLDLTDLPTHSGVDEATVLRDWHARCQAYLPELADALSPTLERVCASLEVSTNLLKPCHRDLHEKQILVAGQKAGFLDFDTLCMADPALDPGNLLAHLFFAGVDERPLAGKLACTNLTLWRSAALLRLAMIYSFTSTPAPRIRRLLGEADR